MRSAGGLSSAACVVAFAVCVAVCLSASPVRGQAIKEHVFAFYESYSAPARTWLVEQLNATWNTPGMSALFDVSFIPYGNAKEQMGPRHVRRTAPHRPCPLVPPR